jgi:Cdc6-like AAA superfamily ATPase
MTASATCDSSIDKKAKETKTTPDTIGHSSSISRLKRSNDSLNNQPTNSKTVSNGLSNAKKVKSVQEDPNASEVYKSLFNTCDKAKNQQKAHWVTFNPQYF